MIPKEQRAELRKVIARMDGMTFPDTFAPMAVAIASLSPLLDQLDAAEAEIAALRRALTEILAATEYLDRDDAQGTIREIAGLAAAALKEPGA